MAKLALAGFRRRRSPWLRRAPRRDQLAQSLVLLFGLAQALLEAHHVRLQGLHRRLGCLGGMCQRVLARFRGAARAAFGQQVALGSAAQPAEAHALRRATATRLTTGRLAVLRDHDDPKLRGGPDGSPPAVAGAAQPDRRLASAAVRRQREQRPGRDQQRCPTRRQPPAEGRSPTAQLLSTYHLPPFQTTYLTTACRRELTPPHLIPRSPRLRRRQAIRDCSEHSSMNPGEAAWRTSRRTVQKDARLAS